jgi:hypothetical protein
MCLRGEELGFWCSRELTHRRISSPSTFPPAPPPSSPTQELALEKVILGKVFGSGRLPLPPWRPSPLAGALSFQQKKLMLGIGPYLTPTTLLLSAPEHDAGADGESAVT